MPLKSKSRSPFGFAPTGKSSPLAPVTVDNYFARLWLSRLLANLFCSANMLYPKENKDTSELMFACRTCQYSEKAASSCVYRNSLDTSIGETAGVTQDVGADPTVGVPGFCALCGLPIRCSFCEDMTSQGCILEMEYDDDDDDEDDEMEASELIGKELDNAVASLTLDNKTAGSLVVNESLC